MDQEEEIKYFVRVRDTDLDGTKMALIALTGIKGIGRHAAKIITQQAEINPRAILGKMADDEIDRIRTAVDNYTSSVPTWMLNRPIDILSGKPRHLMASEVGLTLEEDINTMRKIRSYRGIRHETGQKVRGQRTKSTGRTGTTVGVSRKKA
ncbi:30S ribosomal protein S13 [Methanofollis aquaemaris]|uniref:Small ribosomal subunit protein uS13 n=1 Tax=Methanofollis aquaemaris TaxID=126734 RepID=A0A8A3S7T2_9EURY|nr:30S ribosomal protein S13 [Methanofollis aquaemaris]QSZ67744.1 30S ribosomal protein S13 [Methanofollis aquaemaris]